MTDVPDGLLRYRLQNPRQAVTLEQLMEHWFQVDIRVHLTSDVEAVSNQDPSVADRLRGALGRALMEVASAEAVSGRPCPWDPACTLDVLWGDMGTVRRGVQVPKPFVIRVLPAPGGGTDICLSLFGQATDWAEAVADGLIRALRGGVSLDGGPRRPYDPQARCVQPVDAGPLWDALRPVDAGSTGADALMLLFETPLATRQGEDLTIDCRALLTGLSRRAEGMARWHDSHLAVEGQALADAASVLSVQTSHLRPRHWRRPPNRQRTHDIPLGGFVGPYLLSGPVWAIDHITPLLVLGQAFGAGSHTALGLGRYRLAPL